VSNSKSTSFFYKLLSLLSVIRGYNVLVLILAQYLAAVFIFSPKKSLNFVLLDYQLLFIVLATVCVVSSGYKIKLQIYFLLNFLGFVFGYLISWKAGLFFAIYIFAIWLYSHKLKKHPFVGLISASVLTILPFFAIFVYYKNFSKIIFVHATFLFFILLLRQLIKDLENLRGAMANNYRTFPVKYGERNTRKLGIVFIVSTFIPITILLNYPGIGYMRYYFLLSLIMLIFIGYFLWKSNLKRHYVLLHNILKLMLLLGILSLLFIDPSLVIERVIDKLN